MSQTLAPIRLFVVLFLFWVVLNGSVGIDVLIVGVLVAASISVLTRENLSLLSGYKFVPQSFVATVGYVFFFLKELVKSNLQIARIVLSPALPIEPAIVRVKTRLTSPVARVLLANSITLTPGTLSVELKGDTLYVHWVVAETTDPAAATEAIVAGYEHYLEAMYG